MCFSNWLNMDIYNDQIRHSIRVLFRRDLSNDIQIHRKILRDQWFLLCLTIFVLIEIGKIDFEVFSLDLVSLVKLNKLLLGFYLNQFFVSFQEVQLCKAIIFQCRRYYHHIFVMHIQYVVQHLICIYNIHCIGILIYNFKF